MAAFSIAPRKASAASTKPKEAGGPFARHPRLKDSAELALVSIVKGLQAMAGPATVIEGMVAGFSTIHARDVIAGYRPDTVVGSLLVADMPGMILISLDGALVHAVVELLCGGNGTEVQPTEPRPATPIDHQFAQIVFTLASAAVQTEWAAQGFESAKPAKIDGALTPDVFGPRADEVGLLDMTIGMFGLHGTLRLALPPQALEKFAGGLAAIGAANTDPIWTHQLHRELGRASVALSAFLDANDISLGALAKLQIGQVLPLPDNAGARASLISDGSVLYRGEIGRDESNYSLRIDELVCEPTKVAQIASRSSTYFEMSKA